MVRFMNFRVLLGILLVISLIYMGVSIATYVFSGFLMFIGFVSIVESVPLLKRLLKRTSQLFDVLIFIFSLWAMSSMGITVSIGLSVVGILYTMYYKPYIQGTLSFNIFGGMFTSKPSKKERRDSWDEEDRGW